MKNISCSLRELRGFLTDLEARLKKHKSFRQECIEIRLMVRQLEIYEQVMSGSEQSNPDKAIKQTNKVNSWLALASVAEKVYEIVQRLFDSY